MTNSCLLALFILHISAIGIVFSFKWGVSFARNGRHQSLNHRTLETVVFGEPLSALGTSLPFFSDEEDDEEEESPTPVFSEAPISSLKEGVAFDSKNINGSDVRVGIIMARWNADIIQGLYKGVNQSLQECGVLPSNVFTTYVPGAFEIPVTARLLSLSKRFDVIICLGCLIKGETMHFEYIAGATANGIMQVSLDSYVPCIFGVLTVLNKEQAIKRSQGEHNEGLSWGKSAVEMGLARMSALGFGQKAEAKPKPPLVGFKAELMEKSGNETAPEKKKIGF